MKKRADDVQQRLEKVRRQLAAAGLDGLFVTGATNRRYLSGFTGSAGALLLTAERAVLLTDARYTQQAEAEAPAYKLVIHRPGQLWQALAHELAAGGCKSLGFEAQHMTVAQFETAREQLLAGSSLPELDLQPTENLVEQLRQVKDDAEISLIRRAAALTDAALSELLADLQPGVSELELAVELEFKLKRAGAQSLAFPIIVVSGPRSALPHGQPSQRRLRAGDFVTIDVGCVWQGYASDLTRTIVVGEPTARHVEVYETVLAAQLAGLAAVKPGVTGRTVDAAARKVIEAAGYGQYFGHGLGHGVGLDVHEGPRLAWTSQQVLQPGMVVTVEPGIYLPDWGGVRIEDLVLVTETGHEILSPGITKQLLTF